MVGTSSPPCTGNNLDRAGGLAGPAPRSKCPKVDRIFKNLHEMSIRPTKNADFLPFGYSFERRIDLEGSRYGSETPIWRTHEFYPERCRASPASQKQVGAESVQVKDGIIPTFPRGIGAPGRHWCRASPSYAPTPILKIPRMSGSERKTRRIRVEDLDVYLFEA